MSHRVREMISSMIDFKRDMKMKKLNISIRVQRWTVITDQSFEQARDKISLEHSPGLVTSLLK